MSWSSIKEEFDFKWQQLICAIPPFWEIIIKETDNADNQLLPDHHLIRKKTLIGIEKLNSRQLYSSLYTPTPIHQNLRSILTNYLKLTAWNGNRYIFYHVW